MIKHLSLFLTNTVLFLLPNIAQAQTYTPSNRTPQADNSIGTVVNPTGTNNFNIEGGLQRGQNLFHSFTDFSIPTGGAANFSNPAGTQSIITRVTGNFFSDLNGTLNTNGANFLLINPNGVVFGTNVQLNVGKAFVTSTANGIDFVDAVGRNYNFGVNRAGDAPLISIAPNVAFNPVRLVMGGTIAGSKGIENYGTLQTNNPGQYIGLIGGDITFNGGKIIAPGAKVELGGLVQSGTVGFSLDNGVQFPVNVDRGNVSLVTIGTLPSIIDVRSGGGGSVGIVAKDLTVQGTGTKILAGIGSGLGSPIATAGDIKLDATGNIKLADGVNVFNRVNTGAVGKSGNVEIVTTNLSVSNSAQLSTSTYGQGDAGNIKITATGNVSFDGKRDLFTSAAFSTIEEGAVGKGGNIEITANNLLFSNSGQLQTLTKGKGDAGNIKINVRDLSLTNGGLLTGTIGEGNAGKIEITATNNVSFDRSYALSTVDSKAVGNAGGIEITTRNLSVVNNSQLASGTQGQGDAGNIKITATNNVSFDRVGDALSTVGLGAVGNGGGIEIRTRNLSVTNGSQLASGTQGKGDAGKIQIMASNNIVFDNGTDILSSVEPGAIGNGGGIEIRTRTLSATNGAQVAASTKGKGDGGIVKITATENVSFDGVKDGFSSAAFSTVNKGAEGNGGRIEITTPNLSISNGARLATNNAEKGNTGDILLAGNTISLNNGAIDSKSTSSRGGDIKLVTTDYLLLRNNSIISTDSDSIGKNGNGGNITISSPLIIATPGNNDITANANQGDGGRVNITSQGLFGIQYRPIGSRLTNDITASSTFGQSGAVNVNTPGADPGKDSTELPKVTTDASNQISQACSATNRQNKLTVTGRGGLPPTANEPLTSDVVWQDARAVSSQPTANNTMTNPVKLALPAVGWVFDGKGKVTLIAAVTHGQPTGTSIVCPNIK